MIEPGEKFSLFAFQISVADDLPKEPYELIPGVWVSNSPFLKFDDFWTQWLGTIKSEQFEASNLIIVFKKLSANPTVLDAENQELNRRARHFYAALMLSGFFSSAEAPLLLNGANNKGETEIRQTMDFNALPHIPGLFESKISLANLKDAGQLFLRLEELAQTKAYARFFRVLTTYIEARGRNESLDQLHQYCRCIEGLIFPPQGQSGRKFKSRTQIFIGPTHHDLMGDIYDMRSAVEHLNDHMTVLNADRAQRVEWVRHTVIIENIVRCVLCHILWSQNLWPHFRDEESVANFWALEEAQRGQIWGDIFDPLNCLENFNDQYIRNDELGLG